MPVHDVVDLVADVREWCPSFDREWT